jgi:hypothetical protein
MSCFNLDPRNCPYDTDGDGDCPRCAPKPWLPVPYEEPEIEVAAEVVDGEPWLDEAMGVIDEMGHDLEAALNFIRQYQRALHMVCAPDPNGHSVQLLLQKYDMNHKDPRKRVADAPRKELPGGDDRSLPA